MILTFPMMFRLMICIHTDHAHQELTTLRTMSNAAPQHDAQSETSIHSGDLGVLVYRLNAPDGHCFVPWHNHMTILDANPS